MQQFESLFFSYEYTCFPFAAEDDPLESDVYFHARVCYHSGQFLSELDILHAAHLAAHVPQAGLPLQHRRGTDLYSLSLVLTSVPIAVDELFRQWHDASFATHVLK